MARRVAGDVGQRELRRPLLPGQVAEAQRAGQPGVALRPVGQQQQVRAVGIRGVRIGHPAGGDLGERVRFRTRRPRRGLESGRERDLGTEHRRQPDRPGRLGEADDAVEAVVVGDGEGVEPEPGSLGGQLLGVRGPVEEGEVGVAVELGVGHVALAAMDAARLERLAPPAPRRPVSAGVPRRAARCPPVATYRLLASGSLSPGERGLELLPRPRRVVEPHPGIIERLSAERKFGRAKEFRLRRPAYGGSRPCRAR